MVVVFMIMLNIDSSYIGSEIGFDKLPCHGNSGGLEKFCQPYHQDHVCANRN